jgi:hypothetical protein
VPGLDSCGSGRESVTDSYGRRNKYPLCNNGGGGKGGAATTMSANINNCPTRCDSGQVFKFFCKMPYRFRVVTPPIIRSTYNCNYSIWHCSSFGKCSVWSQLKMRGVDPTVSATFRLWPLTYWDRGFKSNRRHRYLSVVSVVCCQVEVSATSWSLVQRSPTDCAASLCVI